MPQTILIVDDDAHTRDIYSTYLTHEGYRVVCAPDGWDGVQLARIEEPELILLNLSLPRVSGWSAARLIRERQGINRVPIVIVTGHALRGDEPGSVCAHCDAVLPKPVAPKRLLRKVRDLIGEAQPAVPAAPQGD